MIVEYGYDWQEGKTGWYATNLVACPEGAYFSVRWAWGEDDPDVVPAVNDGEAMWLNPATDAAIVEEAAAAAVEAAEEAALEIFLAEYPAKLREIAATSQYGWNEMRAAAAALLAAGGEPCEEGFALIARAETAWKIYRQFNPMRLAAAWAKFEEKRARRSAYESSIKAEPWVFGGKG